MLKLQESLKGKDELDYKLKALTLKSKKKKKKKYKDMKIYVEKLISGEVITKGMYYIGIKGDTGD